MKQQVKFYGRSKPFFEFSNFYYAPFVDDAGVKWDTTEHFFQAMKFGPDDIISIGFKQERLLRDHIRM